MISDVAAGLGGTALFTAAGLALSELSPSLRRLPPASRLGTSYLLGLAAIAGLLYGLSHALGVPLRAPAVWALVALAVLVGAGARLARGPARPEVPGPRAGGSPLVRASGPLAWTCIVVVSVVSLGVMLDALTQPESDWDGRMTWSTQARYVRAAGTVDAPVLRDARWFVSHPRYPLLLPVAQVAVLEAFGRDDDSPAPRALYAACFAALLAIAYEGARRCGSPTSAGLATLAVAVVPFLAYGEGGALSAYSDLPLACFYGAALILMATATPARAGGGAVGMLLGAAVLTKNEGMVLAPWLLAVGSAGPLHAPAERRRAVRDLAVAGAFVLAAAVLLLSWRAGIPNREDEDYLGLLRNGGLSSFVPARLATVAPILLAKMTSWQSWSMFWWTIPVIWLAGWRGISCLRGLSFLLAAAGPLLVACLAYAVHWRAADLAAVSWERFLLQALVPILLLTALAVDDVLGHTRRLMRRGSLPADG